MGRAHGWGLDVSALLPAVLEVGIAMAGLQRQSIRSSLSNIHVIVFVKPVLSSLEVGASRVLGRLGCWGV